MSERKIRCVLCKRGIDRSVSGWTENDGHPAFVQRCPSCGGFIVEAAAISVMDCAVKDEARTREDILGHFRQRIASAGTKNGDLAVITTDNAQDYCYE